MNPSRGGSAPTASKSRQIGICGAGGEAGGLSGNAAVVGGWEGVGMCYPAPARGAPCGRETTRSRFEITSGKFGQRGCPVQKAQPA